MACQCFRLPVNHVGLPSPGVKVILKLTTLVPRICARAQRNEGSPLRQRFIAPLASVRYSEPQATDSTMSYGTLPSRFLNAMENLPNPRAQMMRRDGRWEPVSSQEFLRRVAGLSSAFVELGVKPGDRVGLFSANRPEWHTADFAITGAGAINVPVYFHESPDRMTYILKHCGARVVFVTGKPQLEKLLSVRAHLPELENIVVADAGADLPSECLRYETLIASAGAPEISSYRLRASQVLPGQLASLIYTSGTTGEPKGVMLTHTNLCSNVTDVGHDFRLNPAEDVALSFLPLSHVYGRIVDYIHIFQGCPIAYVPSIDEVPQALLEVQPTVVAAVPRFFEKIYTRLAEKGSKATGLKRMIFDWALKVANQSVPWKARGGRVNILVKLQWLLADPLVYKKVRAGLGGRLRIVSSGGAPLSKELAEFFWAVGVPIYQGYGLTETSPIVSTNYPVNRVGSSGKPIANVLVRVAEDGEILVKGPCVMQGYYKNPEATREVLTEDGWFRTGDIGHLDAEGYLYITDRKKDLIKTAGGKFVAPQPIENVLKTSPYILNAMVVGDKRKFIAALIVPNPATVAARLADEGLKFSSNSELAAHPRTHALIEDEIKRLTPHLAQYETIKRFALLPEDFTFDSGTLTFTLKLKRRVVEEKYRIVIESLYADVAEPRPIFQE
ncbi:MAG: long-chain fatty acid--CoA ligase [Acidobacteria bacterium]|nr:MAG: long-chain fatty acid--CoA ligase [Acidobacteriota bacterium]